ncbi:MAG: GTP cyclohydrolase I [Candidatus Kryptoniota bacterium]
MAASLESLRSLTVQVAGTSAPRSLERHVDALRNYVTAEEPELVNYSFDGSCTLTIRNVPIKGLCPHHLLPFRGVATVVLYLQNSTAGLSKIVQIIQGTMRTPMLQEEATITLARRLCEFIKARKVQVTLVLQHSCVSRKDGMEDIWFESAATWPQEDL